MASFCKFIYRMILIVVILVIIGLLWFAACRSSQKVRLLEHWLTWLDLSRLQKWLKSHGMILQFIVVKYRELYEL